MIILLMATSYTHIYTQIEDILHCLVSFGVNASLQVTPHFVALFLSPSTFMSFALCF